MGWNTQSVLSSDIFREDQAYWRGVTSWNMKDGRFGEFLRVPLSYFTEFSSDQYCNMGVLVAY